MINMELATLITGIIIGILASCALCMLILFLMERYVRESNDEYLSNVIKKDILLRAIDSYGFNPFIENILESSVRLEFDNYYKSTTDEVDGLIKYLKRRGYIDISQKIEDKKLIVDIYC